MNKIVAAILATGFASIAVFGFFAMAHSMSHTNCIAATLNGRVCTATDVFGVAAYHLSAFQKAAQADMPATLSLLAALIAFILVGAALFGGGASRASGSFNWSAASRRFLELGSPQKFSFRHWLSFHENSPNLSSKPPNIR